MDGTNWSYENWIESLGKEKLEFPLLIELRRNGWRIKGNRVPNKNFPRFLEIIKTREIPFKLELANFICILYDENDDRILNFTLQDFIYTSFYNLKELTLIIDPIPLEIIPMVMFDAKLTSLTFNKINIGHILLSMYCLGFNMESFDAEIKAIDLKAYEDILPTLDFIRKNHSGKISEISNFSIWRTGEHLKFNELIDRSVKHVLKTNPHLKKVYLDLRFDY